MVKPREYALFYAIAGLLLCLFYSYPIFSEYVFRDDYSFFELTAHHGLHGVPQFYFMQSSGRQLVLPFYYLATHLVWLPADLYRVRLLYMAMLAANILMLGFILESFGLARRTSFALSFFALAFIPGLAVGVNWVIVFPFAAAIFLALLGGWYALPGVRAESSMRAAGRTGLACLIFFAALCTYQPWAMVFFAPFLLFVFTQPQFKWRSLLRSALSVGAVFGLTMLSYYVIQRRLLIPSVTTDPRWRFEVTHSISERVWTVVQACFGHIVNLWDAASHNFFPWVIVISLVGGLIASLSRSRSGQGPAVLGRWCLEVALTGVLIFVSMAPLVASVGGVASGFRQIVAAHLLLILLLGRNLISVVMSARGTPNRAAAWPLLIGLIGPLLILRTTWAWTASNVREFEATRSQILLGFKDGPKRHMHFICGDPDESFARERGLGDGEFYSLSAMADRPPLMARAVMLPYVTDPEKLVVDDAGVAGPTLPPPSSASAFQVTRGEVGAPFARTDQTILIDLVHVRDPLPGTIE